MKNICLLIVFLFFAIFTFSQNTNELLWVSHFTGTGNNIGKYPTDSAIVVDTVSSATVTSSAKDIFGNIYLMGTFSQTVNQGAFSIASYGGNDVFISKYDLNGNIKWLKKIGSNGNEASSGIKLSNDESKLYLTGSFNNTCNFDALTTISTGGYDVFIACYDTSGNAVWAKNVAWGVGNTTQLSTSIAISENDTLAIIGNYDSGIIDFGSGINFPNNGFRNLYFAKFDKMGTLVNAKRFLSKSSTVNLLSVAFGNNSYTVTGNFTDSLYLNTLPIYNSYATSNLFIYKFDRNGNSQWVRTMRGNGTSTGRSVTYDPSGNDIYVCGNFDTPTLLIDSTSILISTQTCSSFGSTDMILAKYNINGNLQWFRNKGTPFQENALGLSASNSEVMVCGQFANVLNFAGKTITSRGGLDAFMMVYSNNGQEIFAESSGGTLADLSQTGFIMNGRYIFVSYHLSPTISHDGDWDNHWVKSNASANRDLTLACYGQFYNNLLVDSVKCSGGNTGSITTTQIGGRTPYTYAWSDLQSTQNATNLATGIYSVTVIDANGARIRDTVTIGTKPNLALSLIDTTTINCQNISNGNVTVSTIGGNNPFTYTWSGSTSTLATASDLNPGLHYVSVTDVCGTKKDSVFVESIPPAQVSLSTHNILLTCASDLGTVSVQTIDGVAPYSYVWDDPITLATPTRSDLIPGWHYVTVTDVCNVPYKDSVRVNYLPEVITAITSSTLASCPTSTNGQATVQASSGLPPYTYAWSGSSSTTNTATDLNVGWHYVTVTDFCKSKKDSVLIGNMPLLQTSMSAPTPTNCITAATGTATVTATNGGSPYTYIWTSGEFTPNATTLGAGWNYVTVSDVCSTIKKDSVFIAIQSSLVSSVALTAQASCPTSTNGTALATISAGVGPYTFLWANGDVTALADTLPIGWAYVTITDACGPKKDSVLVTNVPLAQVSLSTQNILLTCATDFGTATVLTINGVAPYTYTWDDLVAPTPTRNDLAPGWHFVTVTDVCNIPYLDSVRVNNLPEVTLSITGSGIASCSAGGDGTATVTAISGVPPYSYLWSTGSTTATANNLLIGWQYVSVSDYCVTHVDSVFITSQPPLVIDITDSTSVSCLGGTNGTATVVATNGGLSYTYLWTSGETTATAINLQAGLNYVTVTDLCGSKIDSVLITVSAPMSIAITSSSPTSCAGGNNGGGQVTVTNGASPVTYVWSTNNLFSDTLSENAFAGNLNNAWNYIRVTDFCSTLIDSVQIDFLPVLNASITFSVPASCATTADGKASVTATNGAAPYTYLWSDAAASTGFVVLDLLPGWNYVTVTDQCGFAVDSVNLTNLPALSITTLSLNTVSCAGGSNGSAVVTTTDGVVPFTYLWSTTEANDTATTLITGWNYVSVTDICGTKVDSIEVAVTPVVTASYDRPAQIYCFGDSTARIVLEPLNGLAPYSYVWGDTTLTNYDRTGLHAGKYYFTVTDGCNSTFNDSIIINQPGALSLSMITTNTSFTGLSDGAIDLIMSGGSQPYSYNWSNSVSQEDQANIPEGVYYITVTDNNGCVILDSSTIATDSWHIEIYKAFTPNGDGKNDVWNIKYISAYPNCSVTIFNEWGMQVFESTGYETAWDGTNKKGNKLPAATYYYIIDLKDGSKVYTGYVTLVK